MLLKKLVIANQRFSAYYFIFLTMSFLAYVIYNEQKPTIATVNITGIVDGFVKSTAKQHLTNQLVKRQVKQFGLQLQYTLVSVARHEHKILVPSEAVISGCPDLTKKIENQLYEGKSL